MIASSLFRRGAPCLAALGLALAGATALGAQTVPPTASAAPITPAPPALPDTGGVVVTGMVIDSVSGGTLAGATVQLVQQAHPEIIYSIRTDSLGGYLVEHVQPGRYLAGFLHPRLDSLELNPPLRVVDVAPPGPVRLDLSVPAPSTLVTAICQQAPADSAGLLLGRVRDAERNQPIPGATVTASWPEILISAGGVRQQLRRITAQSDENGHYALCGIPSDVVALVRASKDSSATDDIELDMSVRGVAYRTFSIAPASAAVTISDAAGRRLRRGTARLVGRVRGPDAQPKAHAQVVLRSAGIVDTTDAAGAFALDSLPPGTQSVEVRAIGYTPKRAGVNLANGETDSLVVQLDETVPTLQAVTVYGKKSEQHAAHLQEFLDRRKRGSGYYVTAEQIEQRGAIDAIDALRAIPGLMLTPTGSNSYQIMMRGNCNPVIFVDGVQIFEGADYLSRFLQANAIGGVEVYNSMAGAPPQYAANACGLVLVWTKGYLQ